MTNTKNVEALIEKIGNPGRFQMITYFCAVANLIIVMGNFLAMAFFAAKTKHHCKLGEGESVADFVPIVTNRNNEKQWDGCHIYAGNNTTTTVPCSRGWTYYLEDNEATIISDFNLVCDDAYKSDLSSTIFFAGVMFGALTLGYIADRCGRRPVIALSLLCCGGFCLAICFAQSFVAFTVLRFLLGFTLQGVLNAAFVLGVELFQTKYRPLASVCFVGVGLVIGGGVLAILAYLIKDWRYIQLALAVVPFTQLLMLWFVPESLRWLLLKKKFKQAEAVIKRVVTFNNLPFPYEIFGEIRKCSIEGPKTAQKIRRPQKAGFTALVKSPRLRKTTLFLFTAWFTVTVAFYGLAFNISFLFGDKYVNFGISQVVDIVGVIFMAWAAPRFGRRRALGIGFFLCGVANLVALVTNVVGSDAKGIKILGTVTALLGKCCAMACIMVLYTFTSELYPTVVRNISLGINTFCGKVGGMAAPQILLLGVYISEGVPYAIIGALALLSGVLILRLPETHNQALLDTIEHTRKQLVNPEDSLVIVESDPEFVLDDSLQLVTSV